MYQDYYDESESWGLRNPYARLEPAPSPRIRRPVRLAGIVGAGLSVVLPVVDGLGSAPVSASAAAATDESPVEA